MIRRGFLRIRKFIPSLYYSRRDVYGGGRCCLVGRDVMLTFGIVNRAGGIIILNSTGKIDINNTFEERLRLLETDGLPAVRATLFGENKNRKFKD